MKRTEQENINPEDYWKDAEKLLDQHFKAKRKKRILALLLLLFISAAGLYTLNNHNGDGIKAGNAGINNSQPVQADHVPEIKSISKSTIVNESEKITGQSSPINKSSITEKTSLTETVKSTPVASLPAKENKINTEGAGSQNEITSAPVTTNQTEKTVQPETIKEPTELTVAPAIPVGQQLQSDQNNIINFMLMPVLPFNNIKNEPTAELNFNSPGVSNNKIKSRWDLLIFAGTSLVGNNIKGSGESNYLQRRNTEEQNTFLPNVGLQLSRSTGNWDIRAGFELAMLGEKVSYSPYSNGEYYNIYKEWEQYQHTVSDTDSTYISGILFLLPKLTTISDSILVDVTDTLNGEHYNPAIRSANGTNQHYVIEIPVEVSYQFSRGRIGAGISAGLAPGLVVASKGNYLRNDESGTTALSNESNNQFTLNARAGIEISYLLSERTRLLLKPNGKFYLTGIKEKYGAQHQYYSFGLNVGILYNIR